MKEAECESSINGCYCGHDIEGGKPIGGLGEMAHVIIDLTAPCECGCHYGANMLSSPLYGWPKVEQVHILRDDGKGGTTCY
jgi:hypothetical protein